MKFATRLLVATLAALVAACTNSTSDSGKSLAYIPKVGTPNLVAPDTVFVNVPFEVTAISWGSGSSHCNAPAGTKVEYGPALARIEAYMRYPTGGDLICTADLHAYAQLATVTFTSAGQATIRLMGLSSAQHASSLDSVEKSVIVVRAR